MAMCTISKRAIYKATTGTGESGASFRRVPPIYETEKTLPDAVFTPACVRNATIMQLFADAQRQMIAEVALIDPWQFSSPPASDSSEAPMPAPELVCHPIASGLLNEAERPAGGKAIDQYFSMIEP